MGMFFFYCCLFFLGGGGGGYAKIPNIFWRCGGESTIITNHDFRSRYVASGD